jgi:hypothetical protein
MSSDTPRTDSEDFYWECEDSFAEVYVYRCRDNKDITYDDKYSGSAVSGKFARELEQELNEANAKIDRLQKNARELNAVIDELEDYKMMYESVSK